MEGLLNLEVLCLFLLHISLELCFVKRFHLSHFLRVLVLQLLCLIEDALLVVVDCIRVASVPVGAVKFKFIEACLLALFMLLVIHLLLELRQVVLLLLHLLRVLKVLILINCCAYYAFFIFLPNFFLSLLRPLQR